jgi:hypothetical protein
MSFESASDVGGEHLAVDGERMAAGHPSGLRGLHEQGIHAAHFLFELPRRGVHLLALE